MSMKTRSQSVSQTKDRPNYKRLLNGSDTEESPPRATKTSRYNVLPPPREAPPIRASAEETEPEPETELEAEPSEAAIKDRSKYIDDILKELRGETEESQPPRIAQVNNHVQENRPAAPESNYPPRPPPVEIPKPVAMTPSPVIAAKYPKDSKFPCTFSRYGCSSSFASKNEWKRHVAIQHLQLGFYRCDIGACNPLNRDPQSRDGGYNDFNRKDLFTMHQRRMHAPWPIGKTPNTQEKEEFERSLERVRQRCWLSRRYPPRRSTCGFCGRVFEEKLVEEPRDLHMTDVGPATAVETIQPEAMTAPSQLQNTEALRTTDFKAEPPAAVAEAESIETRPQTLPEPHPEAQLEAQQAEQQSVEKTEERSGLRRLEAKPENLPSPTPYRATTYTAHVNGDPDDKDRDPTAWDDRMEHVGRHLAKGDVTGREEQEDLDLTAWLIKEGLAKDHGAKGVMLIGMEPDSESIELKLGKRKGKVK